jgi:hypothetical protein
MLAVVPAGEPDFIFENGRAVKDAGGQIRLFGQCLPGFKIRRPHNARRQPHIQIIAVHCAERVDGVSELDVFLITGIEAAFRQSGLRPVPGVFGNPPAILQSEHRSLDDKHRVIIAGRISGAAGYFRPVVAGCRGFRVTCEGERAETKDRKKR